MQLGAARKDWEHAVDHTNRRLFEAMSRRGQKGRKQHRKPVKMLVPVISRSAFMEWVRLDIEKGNVENLTRLLDGRLHIGDVNWDQDADCCAIFENVFKAWISCHLGDPQNKTLGVIVSELIRHSPCIRHRLIQGRSLLEWIGDKRFFVTEHREISWFGRTAAAPVIKALIDHGVQPLPVPKSESNFDVDSVSSLDPSPTVASASTSTSFIPSVPRNLLCCRMRCWPSNVKHAHIPSSDFVLDTKQTAVTVTGRRPTTSDFKVLFPDLNEQRLRARGNLDSRLFSEVVQFWHAVAKADWFKHVEALARILAKSTYTAFPLPLARIVATYALHIVSSGPYYECSTLQMTSSHNVC